MFHLKDLWFDLAALDFFHIVLCFVFRVPVSYGKSFIDMLLRYPSSALRPPHKLLMYTAFAYVVLNLCPQL